MKLLYASDYDSQKDIPLSFYDMQRKRFHNDEKDDDFIKKSSTVDLKIRKKIKEAKEDVLIHIETTKLINNIKKRIKS